MNFKNIFILFFLVSLSSCDNNEILIDQDNLLIGNWVLPNYNGEETTFTRGNSLPNEASGVSFITDGEFIERTSGWCGTPPLTFFNVEGTFLLENTLITISTNSYPTNYAWRIVSLTKDELVVKRELTEQEIEHRALMDLYNELYELAYSKTCTNVSDWTFTAFGAKACGGPQGYIPYSTKINVVSFLQKVEAYSLAEKAFNVKWGIISSCDIPVLPISVDCKNGYPVLKY